MCLYFLIMTVGAAVALSEPTADANRSPPPSLLKAAHDVSGNILAPWLHVATEHPSVGYEQGVGYDHCDVYRLFAQAYLEKRWFADAPLYITGYWELDAAYWRAAGTAKNGADDELYEVGVTPVVRRVWRSHRRRGGVRQTARDGPRRPAAALFKWRLQRAQPRRESLLRSLRHPVLAGACGL